MPPRPPALLALRRSPPPPSSLHRLLTHRLTSTSTTATASASATTTHPDQPVAPNKPPSRPDLLQRSASRALPSDATLSAPRRKWLLTLPLFVAALAVSAAAIFNYEKTNSPVVAAVLYALRTSPAARAELGDEIYFASKWAWVWGKIDLVHGDVNVTFRVKGKLKQGTCRFRARRKRRSDRFVTEEWSLTTDDGRVVEMGEGEGGTRFDPVGAMNAAAAA